MHVCVLCVRKCLHVLHTTRAHWLVARPPCARWPSLMQTGVLMCVHLEGHSIRFAVDLNELLTVPGDPSECAEGCVCAGRAECVQGDPTVGVGRPECVLGGLRVGEGGAEQVQGPRSECGETQE